MEDKNKVEIVKEEENSPKEEVQIITEKKEPPTVEETKKVEEESTPEEKKPTIEKHHHHTKSESSTKNEEIDFSALKDKTVSFFKNLKSKKKESGEEISFGLGEVGNFAKKNAKWLIPLVLILITIFISSYFRAMPAYLPATEDWAENQIISYYESQVTQQISQQYPNLPAQNRKALVDKELQKFLAENEEMVNSQIKETAKQFKSRLQDDDGQTYLLAIDPYHWYSMANNYETDNSRNFGDGRNEEGFPTFSLRNGREGKVIKLFPFNSLIMVYFHKFMQIFDRDMSLMAAAFYVPLIIIALSIIPAFFIARKMGGNVGGFFAALIIAINASLLSRTPAGFADTDAYTVFFPLLILWLFLEAMATDNIRNKIILTSISGLCVGIFTRAWSGWWYIFDFILGIIGIYILYQIILLYLNKKKSKSIKANIADIKQTIITGLTFIVTSGIFVTIFQKRFDKFITSPLQPFDFMNLKEVATSKIWPNVLTTVAEFNEVALNKIITQMGGKLLFFVAIIGIILVLFIKNAKGERDIKYALLLVIWFSGTMYASTKGLRFAILIVPALAISFGVSVGIIYYQVSAWISKNLKLSKYISKVVILVIVFLLLLSPLKAAQSTAINEVPSMNDAWYNALLKINEDSTDAVITSWWDFGHWFYSISKRRVTFDGGDQGERIHWVGKTLLTSNEATAVGLLRMLNCGQEEPVHVLEEFFAGDAIRAVNVLNKMMVLNDKIKASKLLSKEGLTKTQIEEILAITYCSDLLQQYYITSEDMIGKAGVWGHFGSWDFKKAAMFQKARTSSESETVSYFVEEFNMTSEDAKATYYELQGVNGDQWISPWPSYYSSLKNCETLSAEELLCVNSLQGQTIKFQVNLKDGNVTFEGNPNLKPNTLVYPTRTDVVEKKFSGQKAGFSILLVPNGDRYRSMFTDPLQANSMFTRLFFLEGHGLKCFSKFDDRQQISGGRIITWKVDFACKQDNSIYLQPKKEVKAAHILISTQERSDEEALQLIEELKENLTSSNFADYAKEYSEDPGSAVNGGDLGWFSKGQMVQEFEETAYSLNKGQISDIIQTQFGYHVLYLQDVRES